PSSTPFSIPTDPKVTAAGVPEIPGNFTLYDGTFLNYVLAGPDGKIGTADDIVATGSINPYTYSSGTYAGNTSTSITVEFKYTGATGQDALLLWGGHIASQFDWGAGNSAISISGSPYHMRLLTFTSPTDL